MRFARELDGNCPAPVMPGMSTSIPDAIKRTMIGPCKCTALVVACSMHVAGG